MSLLVYMLEAGAGLALFYGIFEIFLRKETYFGLNRVYLVAAAGLSFAVPALRLTSPFFTAAAPAPAAPGLSPLPSLDGLPVPAGGLAGAATPGAGFVLLLSIGDLLLVVYAAGVLVCLLKRTGLLIRLASYVRRGPVVRAFGLKVVRVAEDLSPFSFFGFVFLNERSVDDEERRRILAHESVHVRQLHSLDLLLMELVSTLQWFNPLVWPYRKRLQETHEYLADAGVIAQGFGQAEYQLLLLEQHVGAGVFEFANNLRQSQIKRRILMLSKQKSRGPARLKPLLVLPLAALLALAFAEPKQAVSASGVVDQEKAAAAEKATAERADAAKRQLEGLKAVESSLLKDYSVGENFAQKREILAKLQEILRAEEECAWVVTGSPIMAEAPGGGGPARSGDEAVIEKLRQQAKESAVADLQMQQRIRGLRVAEQELKARMEESRDPARKKEYEARLAELRRVEDEVKIAAMNRETHPEVDALETLQKRFLELKRQEIEFQSLLKSATETEGRRKVEEALKKNLDQQKELMAQLEQLLRNKSEPIR